MYTYYCVCMSVRNCASVHACLTLKCWNIIPSKQHFSYYRQ